MEYTWLGENCASRDYVPISLIVYSPSPTTLFLTVYIPLVRWTYHKAVRPKTFQVDRCVWNYQCDARSGCGKDFKVCLCVDVSVARVQSQLCAYVPGCVWMCAYVSGWMDVYGWQTLLKVYIVQRETANLSEPQPNSLTHVRVLCRELHTNWRIWMWAIRTPSLGVQSFVSCFV